MPALALPSPLPCQGALVANYPWDGTADKSTRYEASPDDATFKHLASVYATAHRTMALPDNQVRRCAGWLGEEKLGEAVLAGKRRQQLGQGASCGPKFS